jgi:hypothetical protein
MNFNKIHELKSNNLFKIFLLISLFFLYKTNKKIALILTVFIVLYCFSSSTEKFTDKILTVEKAIDNVNHEKLRIGHTINVIRFEELCYKIMLKAKKDKKLLESIKQKVIKIYGEINRNKNLANYLKFNNLINDSNLPIFINEVQDVVLLNEIKIIVLTMNKNDFENIII